MGRRVGARDEEIGGRTTFSSHRVDRRLGRCNDAVMSADTFAEALASEFERRHHANARFSLRAFARVVGLSHSAVSRLLRARQRPSISSLRRVGTSLGWSETRVSSLARRERLRSLEAAAASPRFVPDARWIAARANLTIDEVQIALQDALRTGRLEMTTARSWKVAR